MADSMLIKIIFPIGPKNGWVLPGASSPPLLINAQGESGADARPMHPDWARSLRDQCESAGVPFLFKQWGERLSEYDRERDEPDFRLCSEWNRKPGCWLNLEGGHGFRGTRVRYAHRIGKKKAGRLLDGHTWDQFPGGDK